MKFILLTLILMFSFSSPLVKADGPKTFEIPRSEVIELTDEESGRIYPVFIKLPSSYKSHKNKSYPVIYLTDALYSFQIVSGATRFPMNTKKMQEAIIVGISYSKGSKGASSRIRDFTHIEDPSWKYQTGGALQHINFIERSVFSFVEKNYRTNGSRTFVGNSLGGLLGAYILFTKPEMFNNYILGSPSVWFMNNDILKLKTPLNPNKHKVFIAVGAEETPHHGNTKNDMVKGAKDLRRKLSQELFPNTEVEFLIVQGANHETAFPTTATQGLYWLFENTKN